MRLLSAMAAITLAGCGGPGLDMRGVTARQVTVGPSSFGVYVRGSEAVAIRRNFEIGPEARGIMARGYAAIELASGCEIVPGSYDGDPALMRARLFCPD